MIRRLGFKEPAGVYGLSSLIDHLADGFRTIPQIDRDPSES